MISIFSFGLSVADGMANGSAKRLLHSKLFRSLCLSDIGSTLIEMIRPPVAPNDEPHSSEAPL